MQWCRLDFKTSIVAHSNYNSLVMQSDIKIQIETCILFIMHGQISKTWKNILINSNKIGNEFHYLSKVKISK